MSTTVLDTSAMLAWLRDEPGAETVGPVLADAVLSTVNWSELAQKLTQHGADAGQALRRLQVFGVEVEAFTDTDALAAAELWPRTRKSGLSLGDRACLATAHRLGLPALTADKAWAGLDVDINIQLIR